MCRVSPRCGIELYKSKSRLGQYKTNNSYFILVVGIGFSAQQFFVFIKRALGNMMLFAEFGNGHVVWRQ